VAPKAQKEAPTGEAPRAAAETSIKLCGFGGQGIILSGMLIGRAAAIYDGMQATFTQSYGPEARGGECSASVIVGKDRAGYPFVNEADVLVAMSQVAYNKYISHLKPGKLLVIDTDLVEPHGVPEGVEIRAVPATAFAEKLGNKIVANVVMLGFFTAVSGAVTRESMERVVAESVPKRFIELNKKAFATGFDHASQPESRR
jgi:2-oxoglutarate ferredoxin oxidoreductase subunit gamma